MIWLNERWSKALKRKRLIYMLAGSAVLAVTTCSPARSQLNNLHEKIAHDVGSIFSVCTAKQCSFSPDGKEIAYISNLNGTLQVWTVAVQGGYPRLVTNISAPVQGVEWNPVDRNWLAFGVNQGELESSIYVVHPDGTGLKRITKTGCSNMGPAWTADGKYVYGSSNAQDKSISAPCLIDPVTGEYKWLSAAGKSGRLLSLTADGLHGLTAYFTSWNDCENYLLDVKSRTESSFLPPHKPTQTWGTLDPSGRAIYLITNIGQERHYLAKITINSDWTTGPFEVLEKRDEAALGFRWSWTILNPTGSQAALTWMQPDHAPILELLDLTTMASQVVALPEQTNGVHQTRYSPDGKSLAVTLPHELTDEDLGDDIWLLDLASKQFKQLTFSPHPGIEFKKMIKPTKVTFKSFDGLELNGWLYKPASQSKPCPYVIDFHGGDYSASTPTDLYQPLLEQGIGVFSPNVRGSSGKGQTFGDLDNGALRVNAIKDIKACVDFLINEKLADPGKIGVQGQSHGGYMAMCALTEFPDLFAAAVETNGPINLVAEVKRLKELGFDCTEYTGPTYDEKLLRDLSPAFKLDRIKVPFMIEQGANDMSTPATNEVAAELKKRRSDFQYLVYPDEGHYLVKTKDKIDFEIKRVEFFVEHLHP